VDSRKLRELAVPHVCVYAILVLWAAADDRAAYDNRPRGMSASRGRTVSSATSPQAIRNGAALLGSGARLTKTGA